MFLKLFWKFIYLPRSVLKSGFDSAANSLQEWDELTLISQNLLS